MSLPATAAERNRILPVIIIGVSGATWSVIDPLLSAGALPGLRQLKSAGAWGVLKSVKPQGDKHYRPQTAWPSLFSGTLPESHGITEYFQTYRDMRSKCIWDFFTEKGLSAGLFAGHPLWPPPSLKGFVIPYPYARDDKTWPPELSYVMRFYRHHQSSKLNLKKTATLLKSFRFVPLLFGRANGKDLILRLLRSAITSLAERDLETRALALRLAKLDFSTAMFLSFYKKYRPHFALLANFEVDYVSHRYWRYHEPDKFPRMEQQRPRLRMAVAAAYARMDHTLRLILRQLPPECIVAFVSEHGMSAEVETSEIGKWQYLLNANSVKALTGANDEIMAIPIARWIVFRRKDGKDLDSGVERALSHLSVRETGLPLFHLYRHHEELIIKLNLARGDYHGVEDIGDLHVGGAGFEVLPLRNLLNRAGPTRSAMHDSDGVVVLKGPGIRSNCQIQGAAITDIVPTLLRAAGIPVPGGLDGRVLDVFT